MYLGVFQKSALDAVGGYDERFTRAQDWELNYRLRKNGGVVYFDPELKVIYRPRSSLKKLALQYFEYGRWRRAVVRQHSRTMLTLSSSAFKHDIASCFFSSSPLCFIIIFNTNHFLFRRNYFDFINYWKRSSPEDLLANCFDFHAFLLGIWFHYLTKKANYQLIS